MKSIFFLFLPFLMFCCQVFAAGPSLSIGVKGKVKTLTIQDLTRLVPETTMVASENPAYDGQSIVYRGVNFQDLLARIGRGINLSDYKIVVTCLDGYRPVIDPTLLSAGRALLAYREDSLLDPKKATTDGMWTQVKMGSAMVSPGPFYLVWEKKVNYPQGWPFQISEILLVPNSEFSEWEKLAPKGAFDGSTTVGFHTFLENCMVCHSIRYTGPLGKAPDLAYVTGYRSEDYIRGILGTGRGAMPAFANVLNAQQIDGLIKYLKASATQKP